MRKVTIGILLSYSRIFSQNLIDNGSFEEYRVCPNNYSEIEKAIGWKMPSKGTSDYFNSCSKSSICSVPKNVSGYSLPKTGNAYAGFGLFIDKGLSYEFLQNKLLKPMRFGKVYCLELFVKKAQSTNYSYSEFSFLFSNEPATINEKDYFDSSTIKLGLLKNHKLLNSSKKDWIKLTTLIRPQNNYNYLTIGFNRINEIQNINRIGKKEVYYYIDDVSLIEIKDSTECACQTKDAEITKKDSVRTIVTKYDKALTEKLVIPNIQFESNKSILLPLSNLELDKLADYLLKNEKYVIEIYGNTDNVGSEKDNISLSKQRADAVSNYLMQKGVSKSRMKTFGFGSRFPVSSNSDDKGRAMNRRVEFKLFK